MGILIITLICIIVLLIAVIFAILYKFGSVYAGEVYRVVFEDGTDAYVLELENEDSKKIIANNRFIMLKVRSHK